MSDLAKQRNLCKAALEEKKKVEDELESLSQALFEEVRILPRLEILCANNIRRSLGEQHGRRRAQEGGRS